MIVLDTSILIDYFRKTKKEKSLFYNLASNNQSFAISVITKYEIEVGAKDADMPFWNNLYASFQIIPFDKFIATETVVITKELKQSRQLIDFANIAIAATARINSYELATLNTKHFSRIKDLILTA
jgi:tRNA(fMet)-specific endonuclease VapC